jgi:SNF2 family DNA or RNA helicase
MNEITTVHEALKYLAGCCDYASSEDGRGYNKNDAEFGHSLAERQNLSYGQATAALRMLGKYIGQLSRAGIVLPETIPAPAAPAVSQGLISVREGTLVIKFPQIPSQQDRDFIKEIKGWRYNPSDYTWSVPFLHADEIIAHFPSLTLSPEIATQRQAEADRAQAARTAADVRAQKLLAAAGDLSQPLPNGQTLFPHQQEAVRNMLANRRMILADDMGLGKTKSALVAAKAWRQAFSLPILVVAPVSIHENWRREAAQVEVAIEVYSWAKLPEIPEVDFVLIADEAHYAQAGNKSKRGEAFLALSLSERCQAVYALTGTPIKNGRPANLFPLLKAVRHPISKDRRNYDLRYCNAHPTRWSRWDVTGATHLGELHEKIADRLLRRTKSECLKDLPEKTRTIRKVEMSAEARRQYQDTFNALRAEYKARLARGEIKSGGDALVLLGQLRYASSVAKVEGAVELAQDILEQGESVVLFTEFVESAKAIAAALSEYGVELLIGETPSGANNPVRQNMVDRFQAKESRVFVSTIKAGGLGITLTASSYVILVDRAWTPGDCDQSEDRCHRIGQKNAVSVTWLQANGSDQKIDEIINSKREKITLVLTGQEVTQQEEESYLDIAHDVFR